METIFIAIKKAPVWVNCVWHCDVSWWLSRTSLFKRVEWHKSLTMGPWSPFDQLMMTVPRVSVLRSVQHRVSVLRSVFSTGAQGVCAQERVSGNLARKVQSRFLVSVIFLSEPLFQKPFILWGLAELIFPQSFASDVDAKDPWRGIVSCSWCLCLMSRKIFDSHDFFFLGLFFFF